MKMTNYTFKCQGATLEINDTASGPATKRANDELKVNERGAGSWVETGRNEFTWAAFQR